MFAGSETVKVNGKMQKHASWVKLAESDVILCDYIILSMPFPIKNSLC